MTRRVNTYGTSFGPLYDLQPGQQHDRIAWGDFSSDKVVSEVTAKPIVGGLANPPGEKVLEILNFSRESTDS